MNKGTFDFRPDPKPEKTVKPKKVYKYKRKPTGEKEVFEEIAKERPHRCQICDMAIMDLTPSNFMHVLPKAQNKYPKLKLEKQNIVLACDHNGDNCHYKWDFERYKTINRPEWEKIYELEASLKEQYKLLHLP